MRSPAFKARTHLILLALAALLPVALFSVFALNSLRENERAALLGRVADSTHAIAQSIDLDLARVESAVRVLSHSLSIRGKDWATFYRQAQYIAAENDVTFLVYDATGQQLVNTGVPFGTPLPRRGDPRRIPQVLEQTGPSVSGYALGAVRKQPVLTVDMPFTADDGTRLVLTSAFSPEYVSRVITSQQLPPTWIVGVFDREGLTLARSHRAAEYLGRPGGPTLRNALAAVDSGELRSVTRDGHEVLNAFTHVKRSGWAVAVGIPVAEAGTMSSQAVITLAAGFVVALGFAVLASGWLARRFADQLTQTADAARGLTGTKPLPLPRSTVAEVDGIHAAIRDAQAELQAERAARHKAEKERAALLLEEQAARARAERENRAKDDFLAMLGHELRNPMSAIAAASAVAQRTPVADDRLRFAHDVISRQSRQMGRLLDDLLDVGRVMQGRISLKQAPIDLAALVRATIELFRGANRLSAHEVSLRTDGPAFVMGDAVRLQQVVSNLLDNAVKYTPAGGRVLLAVRHGEDRIVFTVSDDGAGMEPELLAHAFDLFVQGDRTLDRAAGGLGVGLALVRQLVELHDGQVSAHSDGPSRGSIVTISLPLCAAPPESADEPEPAESLQRLRMLVVDDQLDAGESLSMMLILLGHDANCVTDGVQALELARTTNFDVIVLDIGMPGMDGYQVAHALRSLPGGLRLKLIALTGYGQDHDAARAFASGFDLHLVKPVDPDRLQRAIAKVTAGQADPSVSGAAELSDET
jgi:signal transduction histidine kinase/ActR/RegA family two-component response regulator